MVELAVVTPPVHPVYRVAWGSDPFAVRAWDSAAEDGTFGNRFDDPGGMPGLNNGRPVLAESERFRMLYCSTQRAGAFGETLARFRLSPRLLALASDVHDVSPVDPAVVGGAVPADWRHRRRLGITSLSPSLSFVDIVAGRAMTKLRHELAPCLVALGLDDIDLSVVTGRQRRVTQEIARYVYERADCHYAGVRYVSRLDPAWECWAIFADRIIHAPEPSQIIAHDDPGLLEATTVLGLRPPAPY